jgi:uncharacterized membrane protein YhaH (DUF805 family)
VKWIIQPLKDYAQFNGRSRRTEFLVFAIFVAVLTLVAYYLDELDGFYRPIAGGMEICVLIVTIASLLPTLALSVRRLHDTGRAGWWIMLFYLPWLSSIVAVDSEALRLVEAGAILVGGVALIVLLLLPGEPDANRFGPNPRDTRL